MTQIKLSDLKNKTGIGFGSSGIRGLVTDLSNEVVYAYTLAFIEYLKRSGNIGESVAIAGDLRDSTPRIMRVVTKAISDSGLKIINCGFIPTPAVAFFGITKQIASIMITGSHIPQDRNGLKFYKADGEVLKKDEEAITEMEVEYDTDNFEADLPEINNEAKELFINRYSDIFPKDSLAGMKIGLYEHSAVGRDITEKILTSFGAEVIKLGFSSKFVPVDTEVIDSELENLGKEWGQSHNFDALISTDGDGDRPLLGDENGIWLRSDILGIYTAKYLKAGAIVVPVSCNTALDKCQMFDKIVKTKIGSPYIVQAMIDLENEGYKNVIGYEANGGFFTEKLPTRDAIIPLLCWLVIAKNENKTISELMSSLPKRFTESDSVKGFPTEISLTLLEKEETIKILEERFGEIKEINRQDGLRVIFKNEEIIHLRPSKNSPEFRDYVEADSPVRAKELSLEVHNLILEWNK